MLPSCHQDPTAVNDSAAVATPGALYVYKGNIYRYVQFKDAVTYVAGHCCVWADTTATAVTNDKAGGSAVHAALGAGLCVRVMTQNYYGYLLVNGVYASALGDGSVAAGDAIYPHATTDGAFDTRGETVAAQSMGQALSADDSSNLFAMKVDCL